MTNEQLAERIWDEVFGYEIEAHYPEQAAYADVATQVMRHEIVKRIAAIITKYS